MANLHEECGVFGVYSPKPGPVADLAYYGLYALQHRGQESCGIVVNDDGVFASRKDIGLVNEVFSRDDLMKFPQGRMAVAHARYGTTGGNSRANCQPIEVNHQKGKMALAHNGNLSNAYELRSELELGGAIFHTTSDTEIIAYIVTQARLNSPSIENALSSAMSRLEGPYSLCSCPPQSCSRRATPTASARCATAKRSTAPMSWRPRAALSPRSAQNSSAIYSPARYSSLTKTACARTGITAAKNRGAHAFLSIYFARPDSVIDGVSVHAARRNAGAILSKTHPVEADVVMGVPDSGIDAALGYAEASGIPYGMGFIKNKYIGRTFISPGQDKRIDQVRIKLSAISESVKDKRIVLIDDSIVRGTTSRQIVNLLREAGAKEVHMRISSPPFMHPCYYGTDVDSRENLIACHHSVEEIADIIGADSLGYLPESELKNLIGSENFCSACFNGVYPTPIPDVITKDRFEGKLSERNK